jgi:HTH-type transcriptional regulator/antitoxin HigA
MANAQREWHPYQPTSIPAPGETLRETLEELGLTQSKLATRTGLTLKHINQIIQGNATISPETAVALERSTDVPASFWNALEANYQDHRIRVEEADDLAQHAAWLEQMPIADLRKRGYVTVDKRQPGQLLQEVLKFFGVASIDAWREAWQTPAAAFLQSKAYEVDVAAVAAWLRLGEIAAAQIPCAPFDRAELRKRLPELRALTTHQPRDFYPKLVRICSEAGVAVVLVPEVPGARVSGATRFLSPSKAVIQLSNRRKRNDFFWFAFFHEIGHLLLHGKKETFIDYFSDRDADRPDLEAEANDFAGGLLIPKNYDARVLKIRTPADAVALASELDIAPGIVAGRYQREVENWSFGSRLFQKFEIVDGSD